MPNPRKSTFRRRVEEPYRVDERITAPEVRVVGDNVSVGIYTRQEALQIARDQGINLVEISPNASPPVCKVIEYSKFKYEQKKKQKELKAKAQKTVLKEIRFGPNTDEHDFNFKLKHAIKFLGEGAKVKVYVQFSGRNFAFKERGELLLLRFAQALEVHGKIEQLPKMEGRRMILTISPQAAKK